MRPSIRSSSSAVKFSGSILIYILGAMKYFALFYDAGNDYVERRQPYREAHLKVVKEAYQRSEILMAGALGDPPSGALLVFHSADTSVAEQFARNDPYVKEGVVTRWYIRPWNVVVGGNEFGR